MPNELMSIGYIFGNNSKTGVPLLTFVQKTGVMENMNIYSQLQKKFQRFRKFCLQSMKNLDYSKNIT